MCVRIQLTGLSACACVDVCVGGCGRGLSACACVCIIESLGIIEALLPMNATLLSYSMPTVHCIRRQCSDGVGRKHRQHKAYITYHASPLHVCIALQQEMYHRYTHTYTHPHTCRLCSQSCALFACVCVCVNVGVCVCLCVCVCV